MCILNSSKKNYPNKDKVAAYLRSWDFNNGAKLMEFSWIGNKFVEAFESLIVKDKGKYAGLPIIVAGDYADPEPLTTNNAEWNIYGLAGEFGKKLMPSDFAETKNYRYLINEDKGVFFDTERAFISYKDEDGEIWQVHPLTILCCDGNGRGGGDYHKKHRMVGAWKRNVVVVSDERPDETKYREVYYKFYEKW